MSFFRRPAVRLVLGLVAAGPVAAPAPGAASFEKGGLLDAGPRSAALGGACAPVAQDALSARGSPASLAHIGRDYVQVAAGVATQSSLVTSSLAVGSSLDGIGVAALLTRAAFTGGNEHALALAAGMPIAEAPWFSLGAAVKLLRADLGTDAASGFAFDASVFARPPLSWEPWGLRLSAGVEDALGGLSWRTGLREDLPRLGHAGVAVVWAEAAAVLAEVQFVDSALGRENIVGLGCEYGLRAFGYPVALRLGFRDGASREVSVGGGAGAKVHEFLIDYALVGMTESQGFVHSLSIQWTFGRRLPGYLGKSFFTGKGRVKPDREVVRITSSYQTMRFRISCSRDCRGASSWAVIVMSEAGEAVWSEEGKGKPDSSVTWNLVTESGDFAPSGTYSVQLVLRGQDSVRYVSNATRFRIERAEEAPESDRGDASDELSSP